MLVERRFGNQKLSSFSKNVIKVESRNLQLVKWFSGSHIPSREQKVKLKTEMKKNREIFNPVLHLAS